MPTEKAEIVTPKPTPAPKATPTTASTDEHKLVEGTDDHGAAKLSEIQQVNHICKEKLKGLGIPATDNVLDNLRAALRC